MPQTNPYYKLELKVTTHLLPPEGEPVVFLDAYHPIDGWSAMACGESVPEVLRKMARFLEQTSDWTPAQRQLLTDPLATETP